MAGFTALYDACVLYPAPLRDLLMHLAMTDPDDRHVLAAAIHAGADVIVTYNLEDFPKHILDPLGIEAQHPDIFGVHALRRLPATHRIHYSRRGGADRLHARQRRFTSCCRR